MIIHQNKIREKKQENIRNVLILLASRSESGKRDMKAALYINSLYLLKRASFSLKSGRILWGYVIK